MALSGFVVGSGTLPIQCAEIFMGRGHAIRGVLSSDPSLLRWAEERGLACGNPRHDLLPFLRRQPFDVLFSIVNEHLLPAEVLEIPRKAAINYHDGPLPRYGGTHATSWAIINQEKSHGITWHLMTEAVDAGAVLKQTTVNIAEGETAFTLNAKCYQTAISSFADLVRDLEGGRVSAAEQNLDDRTFYPRFKRPEAACVFRWHQDAEAIAALVRGLDFGPYPNPLGLGKIAVGGDFVLVREVRVATAASHEPPGTVTTVGSDTVKVSTGTRDLELRGLQSIDGGRLPIGEFVEKYDLSPGRRLPELDGDTVERLTAFHEAAARHEAFWVDRLSKVKPLRLPPTASRDLPAGQGSRYRIVPLPMSSDLIRLPEEGLPGQNWTDFLAGAFAAFLTRISHAESFDIGFRDERSQGDGLDFEGLFAPWVPLSVPLTDGLSLDGFIRELRVRLDSIRHRGTYARDLSSRYPHLRGDGAHGSAGKWPVSVHRVTSSDEYRVVPGCEITLALTDDPARCRCVFDAQVHPHDSVLGMLRQYVTFLEGAAADPARPVAELPLLSPGERDRILVHWNRTATPYPTGHCIHQLFEARVEEDPDRVALVAEDGSLTYGELESRANRLAGHLAELGVKEETLVGVSLPRTTDMVVAVLGILKAGGAYLPLDPDLPSKRLGYMLEDGRAEALVTHSEVLESFPAFGGEAVCVDRDGAEIASRIDARLDVGVDPDRLAYVIYTSGSTGRPKGVEVTHQNVVNLLSSMARRPKLSADDILVSVTRLSFDISVLELFGPLSVGGRVVLAESEAATSGEAMRKSLGACGATIMQATPAGWRSLLDAGWQGDRGLRALVGGEAFPSGLARELAGCCGEVWNMYGPTETTVYSSCWRVPEAASEIRIGAPIGNTQIYVLDSRMQPVPVGVPGELYIGGVGVARGYRNHPELTAERFVPDRFRPEPGARLYRTGDRVRFRDDGTLEFMGRLDDQVKIRGFRIELGEIEAVLVGHEAVRQVAVMVHGEGVNARLVAYVVFEEESGFDLREMRRILRQFLPDYMVPSLLVELDKLPLTPSGKVHRKALPEPGRSLPREGEAFVAPRTPTEEALAGIWAEVLGQERVGVHDDFFALGGHSLLATQILSRVARDMGVRLALWGLFESPTVAELAREIEVHTAVAGAQGRSNGTPVKEVEI
jgi:amino acid adenylation domain-containing protein